MDDTESPERVVGDGEQLDDLEEDEEPEYLDDLEKVSELEDDQGFGGQPPQTFPGQELEEEEDEAPVMGWDPDDGASDG